MKNDNQKLTPFPNIIFPNPQDRGPVDDISEVIKRFNIKPKNICQIGAANSGGLEYMEFIENGAKATLIEPHPEFYKELVNKWGNIPNINILNLGIWKENGIFKFYKNWAGTFISELKKSPTEEMDHYIRKEDDSFMCRCVKFSEIDKGNFDIVLIDVEGCEWFIIQEMKSRPLILLTELYNCYHNWTNPFLDNIKTWMIENKYVSCFISESDVCWIRSDFFSFVDAKNKNLS